MVYSALFYTILQIAILMCVYIEFSGNSTSIIKYQCLMIESPFPIPIFLMVTTPAVPALGRRFGMRSQGNGSTHLGAHGGLNLRMPLFSINSMVSFLNHEKMINLGILKLKSVIIRISSQADTPKGIRNAYPV